MAITGNNALSIRKRDLSNQKSIAVGFKKMIFAHKAAAGETGISVGALNPPTELTSKGFTNPTTSDILAADMRFFRKNVKVISSAKGELMDYISYDVKSSSQINWVGFTSDVDEIFTVEIDHSPRTGLRVVDANPLISTGVLTAGQTDYNVGQAFEVAKYISQQIGAVTVFVDGVQKNRNISNSASGANYQEVDTGNGLGSIIRFNSTEAFDQNIAIISTGLLVEKPNESQLQEIESSQGQIDAMIPTLATLAGVPESTFQAAPNNIDLKSFGDRFQQIERWRLISASDDARDIVDKVLVDCSGTAVTLTLPLSPNIGDSVWVQDAGDTFTTNICTVARNGNLIDGVAADFTASTDGAWIEFIFRSGSIGWIARV